MGELALSYSAGETDVALLEETIGANLERIVTTFPGAEAMVEVATGRRWTYAEFDADVTKLASGLLARGLEVGDRCGIWAPNSAEWTLLQYATAKIGVVLVTINPAYRTHELEYALRQSGCRMLVSAPAFKTSDYAGMIAQVRAELPMLDEVVFLASENWLELAAGTGDADAVARRMAGLSNLEPINIQYTSGTTGFPKGATLSHRNILNNGYFVGELCGYTEADRVCIPVPFYHCFGMVMGNLGSTSHGACMVIPAPSFEPDKTLAAVEHEKCTSLYGVPTMFIAELALADFASYDLSSLRTGIMAGSPCPVEVMKRVVTEMNMHEVTICYGMTETSPVSTQTRADDSVDKRVGSVGQVHPHVEVQVVDAETGDIVTRGATGELCTRGYSVMRGYWEDPIKTAEAIDADGWMHTGDLATMDADGYLNIVGRIKDMVIRGGENVYPREVEEFLFTHERVADVQVVGVPDLKYGEELCAWVKLNEGPDLTEDEIRDFCKGRLAHFKIPRYVLFVDDFPMTITGKIQKFKMRDLSISLLDLEVAASTTTA